jgi:AcrR family transcriptional regulator
MTGQAALTPQERILEAVVVCIEKDGYENLTTRKIAELAGTNIASINYYFRSKDRLVAEALSMTLRHMLEDIYALIEQPEQPFLEMLEEVFFYLIDGGLRFPGVILAHLHDVLNEKRYDRPVVSAMREVFELLASRADRAYPGAPQERLRLALWQASSAVFFTMLAPGFFQPVAPLDLDHPEGTRRLARYLTRVFVESVEIKIG